VFGGKLDLYQEKIMRRIALGLVSSLISIVTTSTPSIASPFVYTTGGLLNSDLKTCLEDAKKAANKAGFTSGQEEAFDEDKKDANFYAYKSDSPISLAVRCFPSAGVYAIAVSGINNDASWKDYQKFVDIWFKK